VDVDGDRSVRQTGNGRYMMTPVIGIVSVNWPLERWATASGPVRTTMHDAEPQGGSRSVQKGLERQPRMMRFQPSENPPCVYCGHLFTRDVTPDKAPPDERWYVCADCQRSFAVRFIPSSDHGTWQSARRRSVS